jgi:hypothetical protein
MASIRTAGLTKNLGHLRAVNGHTLDLPEGVPSTSRPVCGRTGHPVATTPGPYRAEHLAYLVELADTGHYQTVTQTTVDLDDIAPAHRGLSTMTAEILAATEHPRSGYWPRRVTP